MSQEAPDENTIHHCSFCGQSQYQVRQLMAGAGNTAYICNECVELCSVIMVEREFVAQYMTYVIGLSQKQIKKMAAQGITARTLLKDICGRTIPADMSIEELLQKIGSAVAVRLSRAFESAR